MKPMPSLRQLKIQEQNRISVTRLHYEKLYMEHDGAMKQHDTRRIIAIGLLRYKVFVQMSLKIRSRNAGRDEIIKRINQLAALLPEV